GSRFAIGTARRWACRSESRAGRHGCSAARCTPRAGCSCPMAPRWLTRPAPTCRCHRSWSAAWSTPGRASRTISDGRGRREPYSCHVGVEHEIKISVPAEFVLPDLEGAGGLHAVDRGVHVLDTTYWDTDSLQLLNSHQGLRYRTTDGQGGIWTVKAKTRRDGLALVREETEFEGAANRPPEAAIRELGAVVDPSALHPVARLRAERHVVDLVDSGEEWAE